MVWQALVPPQPESVLRQEEEEQALRGLQVGDVCYDNWASWVLDGVLHSVGSFFCLIQAKLTFPRGLPVG